MEYDLWEDSDLCMEYAEGHCPQAFSNELANSNEV